MVFFKMVAQSKLVELLILIMVLWPMNEVQSQIIAKRGGVTFPL